MSDYKQGPSGGEGGELYKAFPPKDAEDYKANLMYRPVII